MKVWKLEGALDGFEEIQLADFEKDYDKYFDEQFYKTTSIAEIWSNAKVVTLNEGKKSDCPHLWDSGETVVLSERALNTVSGLIKDQAEALPLIHPEQRYYAIHVVNAVDAIDYDRAKVRKLSTGLRVGFDKYAFIPGKLKNQHIFGIYLNTKIYPFVFVSDEFKRVVESNGLVGFQFIEIWDSEKE
jgi:hypothetical protein